MGQQIIDINDFSEWIGLKTESSKKCLTSKMETWNSDHSYLRYMSDKYHSLKHTFTSSPNFFKECDDIFNEIATIETKIEKLIATDELEMESYNELLFVSKQYPIFKPLNFIPFFLTIWSALRVYILPLISIMLPLMICIVPYFIITYVFAIPMNVTNYIQILYALLSGSISKVGGDSPIQTEFSTITLIKQASIILFTFIQGVIQPYWTYRHLHSIDSIINENGEMIMRFEELYKKLETSLNVHGFVFFTSPLPELDSSRSAMAHTIWDAFHIKLALKYIGNLEVLMKLAHCEDLHPVKWVTSTAPVFTVKDSFDYQVCNTVRKTISATFDNQYGCHALLTGPNKGGKSTVLRALSGSALLAHTYGCGFGYVTATPFSALYVCLKPDDLPGEKSRFEREIEFTAGTLKTTKASLVFIDELYHSTNPPDALRSCQIYTEKLWNKPNIISVISTHLFEFVESADKKIQRLCCLAEKDATGKLQFNYELTKGICKVSSVDLLLQKHSIFGRPCSV
jgi:hypothetical protein